MAVSAMAVKRLTFFYRFIVYNIYRLIAQYSKLNYRLAERSSYSPLLLCRSTIFNSKSMFIFAVGMVSNPIAIFLL